MVGERWMRWTLLESATKTSSKLLQKNVGTLASSIGHTFFAAMVVGLVQMISGFIVVKKKGKKLWDTSDNIWGSILFGLMALTSTILVFTTFLYGGEIGTNTFIITLSIIPGAFIDLIFFKHRLSARQWLGVACGIAAGYFVLGNASLGTISKWPTWIWLSIATTVTAAINQGITQKIKGIDPFVKNFWGGGVAVVCSLVAMFALGSHHLLIDTSHAMQKLWAVSLGIGMIVVAMWSFNVLSYRDGASIALKKLVMNGAYLISTLVIGSMFLGEKFTTGKAIGIGCYFMAFVLMDNGTWNFLASRWQNKDGAHEKSSSI